MVLWVQSRRDGGKFISEYRRRHDIKNDIVDRLKNDKKKKNNMQIFL